MALPTFEEKLEYYKKQYVEEHSCKCPFCGYDLTTECEDMINIVTYWGEEGPIEEHCNHCGKDFWVEEHVDRTWKTFETAEAAKEDDF